ncbi:MAG: hypothetical protein A3F10_01835 [Coxiella sp. RIFCSPHIGHO2_12_FULL_42_15]|nr:MAG: hypothetical protein A3F10_01835 [Coxiella sp. RIFCSPHIGHO2_12_FULL_42_15]
MDEAEFKKRRLRWKCRRGMLELDILLVNYFNRCYDTLDLVQQQSFEALLEQEDVVLYAWLMGEEQPHDVFLQKLVADIGALRARME